ncbi:MAG: hypothetical protein C3F02_03050 [Parcubacteria group bacterium]|nr:MAG: hypothetical protein C3F02_03050 [Parcubacteria group bacterium]
MKGKKIKKGFTLIETIMYFSITAIILITVGSLVINIYNAKKMQQSSDSVNHNARFILNFIANRVHNVDYMEDVSPAIEKLLFYTSSTSRFSITLESDKLVYRQSDDQGGGFPAQSSVTPVILNSSNISVSGLTLQSLTNNAGVANKGVEIGFTLTTAATVDPLRYLQQTYQTFISIR